MYRNDCVKGGGGVIAHFSSALPSKKLKLPRNYKTIEPLAIQSSFGGKHVIVVGKDCYLRLEEELNNICSWATLQRQSTIIMGDLILNRLQPDQREGKILHERHYLIGEPNRVTQSSSSLLDVLLTNKPDLFRECGVYV